MTDPYVIEWVLDLGMDRSMRLRLQDFLSRPSVSPHLD